QKYGPSELYADGAQGGQSLPHLGETVLAPRLFREHPAAVDRPHHGKEAKSVVGRIHERFILQFLRSVAFSATEVKTSGEVARVGHAERVIERARQGERLAHARGRARRMPQQL